MEDNRFPRISDVDDPERCQGTKPSGPCDLKAVPGGRFCLAHGGAFEQKNQEQKSLRNYRLSKFRVRTAELGNSDQISSLKDEVALLRLLIEEMVNSCEDTTELLLRAGPLADLLMKAEKLVTSCHRIDSKLGNLLDKAKVLQFAQLVIEIISAQITEESILDSISEQILKAIGDL